MHKIANVLKEKEIQKVIKYFYIHNVITTVDVGERSRNDDAKYQKERGCHKFLKNKKILLNMHCHYF